ncbi:Biotin synthase [Frankliniella fusca]|uniref:Biotin synthase n=1 Tax=Frankliniella fusca TaxID=407009 RepID=A0AAE1GRV9_9NEOP|nr:Biotin synthase [Frankliniella fusca]
MLRDWMSVPCKYALGFSKGLYFSGFNGAKHSVKYSAFGHIHLNVPYSSENFPLDDLIMRRWSMLLERLRVEPFLRVSEVRSTSIVRPSIVRTRDFSGIFAPATVTRLSLSDLTLSDLALGVSYCYGNARLVS